LGRIYALGTLGGCKQLKMEIRVPVRGWGPPGTPQKFWWYPTACRRKCELPGFSIKGAFSGSVPVRAL
jgi:hypothetical protein